jgi:hypothetical protein
LRVILLLSQTAVGLPPADERAFLATLIAEATNLGLSRMAEVCGAGSRRALLRMQTWHMREETFRAALACLTDAIHAEPIAAWFGQGHRVSADGQAFYLGGPGEAGGAVNAHYGRDPVVAPFNLINGELENARAVANCQKAAVKIKKAQVCWIIVKSP